METNKDSTSISTSESHVLEITSLHHLTASANLRECSRQIINKKSGYLLDIQDDISISPQFTLNGKELLILTQVYIHNVDILFSLQKSLFNI